MFLSHYIQGSKQIMAETKHGSKIYKQARNIIQAYHPTDHVHIHHNIQRMFM